MQGTIAFDGTITTGPDGLATATLDLADAPPPDTNDDGDGYDPGPAISLTAVTADGRVTPGELVGNGALGAFPDRFDVDGYDGPDGLYYDDAIVRADHLFAGPGTRFSRVQRAACLPALARAVRRAACRVFLHWFGHGIRLCTRCRL